MTDDNPASGTTGPKRPPPTIDLDPSQVTVDGEPSARGSARESVKESADGRLGFGEWARSGQRPSFDNMSAAITPALSGATAAALILTGAWLLGLSGDNRPQPVAPAPASDTAAVDALSARMSRLETDATARKNAPPLPAVDPAMAARVAAMEAALKSANDGVAALRGEFERLTAVTRDAASAPREAAALPDIAPALAPINDRLNQIEQAQRALGDVAQRAAKPSDDLPIRRAVAASALDLAVRQGEPFASALTAAKAVAPNAALQPLEAFAAAGVPSDATLARELAALLPQLSPQPPKQATTSGVGMLDRLQASASGLVRIERTDAAVTDRSPQLAKISAAARSNDIGAAVQALSELPAPERVPAQGWIEKVSARDAARKAARQFAADTVAALGKTAQ